MPSLDRVRWQEWTRWLRARPWPVWAAAAAVFVLFAALGSVTRGPGPAPVAAHSLTDGIERGTGTSVAPEPTAAPAPSPRYPGVAYPTVPGSSGPMSGPPTPTASGSYPNCAAAEAAGVAPIRRGRPGYSPALDRDGDGVACDQDSAPSASPPAPSRTPTPSPTPSSPSPDPSPTPTATASPTPEPTATDAAVSG